MSLYTQRKLFTLYLTVASLFIAGDLLAETIYMKDGRVIQGKILNQNRTQVQIQTATGALQLSKNDIIRIQYALSPQELKAEEDRRRLEDQRKAEENRRRAEEQKKSEEDRLKQEESRKAREKAESDRREEERNRKAREEQEAANNPLRRRRFDLTLSAARGDRQTVIELLEGRFSREMSKAGFFNSVTPWKHSVRGPQLQLASVRDSWRFEARAYYRALQPDQSQMSATDIKPNEFEMLMGILQGQFSSSSNPPVPGVGFFHGSGAMYGYEASVEREFLRDERKSLGLRLSLGSRREKAQTNGLVYSVRPASNGGGFDIQFPTDLSLKDAYSPVRLEARIHRYQLAGGEFLIGAGWLSARGTYSQDGRYWHEGYSPDGSLNTLEHQIWGLRMTVQIKGPVGYLEYSHPIAGGWDFVLSLDGEDLLTGISRTGGNVLISTLYTTKTGGGGLPLIPLSLFGPKGLPGVLSETPMHATVAEFSFGLRRRFGT